MSKELQDITALVVDHGLFLPFAQKLGETYGRVYYYTPFEEGFPTLNRRIIGDGYDKIERCNDPFDVLGELDLAVFPDIQHSGLQLHLEALGIPVWGSRKADSLELDREKFLGVLKDVGLDVPEYEVVVGLSELRKHLKSAKDKFIKISFDRGSHETWHWRDRGQDEGKLDLLAVNFGAAREYVRFLVCDSIQADLELGYDGVSIDGKFPQTVAIQGYEAKDKAYLMAAQKYSELPDSVRAVNEAFAPVLKEYRYRNFWSTEIRVNEEGVYFIDPCCRAPSPAGECQLELYSNLGEIVWAGANGELVEPVSTANFAAQCVLSIKDEGQHWVVFNPDAKLRPWLKCGNSCEIDGKICFPPTGQRCDELGWLVALGDTVEEALDILNDRVALLPDGVTAHTEALVDLLEEVHEAEEEGIQFSDEPLPEPATALGK